MTQMLHKLAEKNISRRDFLKGSATAAAAVAGLSLAGSSVNSIQVKAAEEAAMDHEMPMDPENEGEWITAACWHNCGGRCVIKALVKDGVVIREKTDDTHADSPDFPQQRACVRGRSQRNHIFGADRLRYPIKRVHWSPDDPHGELRGMDEWEQITWDEALDYVADEIKKIIEKYGNRAIWGRGTEVQRFFNHIGGCTRDWGTTSLGSFTLTPGKVGTTYDDGQDRLSMKEADYVILWGVNPGWSSAGNPLYNYLQAKKAGVKFIGVDPYYNESLSVLEAEWVPCRPSMDTAMMIGVAYEMLKLDEEQGGIIDWDFLNSCTIGFDAEHMPEGADPADNFKDYLLGTNDGVVKDAEWASALCGATVENIKYLAEILKKDNKVCLYTAWGVGRNHNADNLPQMLMTLGAMGGHYGQPGNSTGPSGHATGGNGGPSLVKGGGAGLPNVSQVIDDNINDTELWRAINTGSYNFVGNGGVRQAGEIRDIDIHMLYHGWNAILQARDGMTEGIKAHRKVDFVVCHAHALKTEAKYADIVLPVNSEWERCGSIQSGNREMLIFPHRVTEDLYGAHSDQWIVKELAKRFPDADFSTLYPISEEQQWFNKLAGTTVIDPAGSGEYVPLITITQEDIDEMGVEGEPQEGVIGLKELLDQGVYQVERFEGDGFEYIPYKEFREDPEANPRPTDTGKFEIYSNALATAVNDAGWSEIKPYPTYIRQEDGYERTQEGEFPYQVYNPHYLRRSHTTLDNVQWLREAWPNPVYISKADAEKEGIASGDTVLITSPHGCTLRKACVTGRFIPGVIGVPHGSWVDIDEETGIDTGGADNILCGGISTGQGVSGWNTCCCKIEKYDGEIPDDIDKPLRMPVMWADGDM